MRIATWTKNSIRHEGTCLSEPFISTFTDGPLGVVSRTGEFCDADPDNNRDHYFIADAMGGNVGVMSDHRDDYPFSHPAFQVFDAFGNALTNRLGHTDLYSSDFPSRLCPGAGRRCWPRKALSQPDRNGEHFDAAPQPIQHPSPFRRSGS